MASAIIRRGMATSAAVESAIKHVTVIGGGLMGSGIAQVSFVTFFARRLFLYVLFIFVRFGSKVHSPQITHIHTKM